MNKITVGISSYSSFLKLSLSNGKRFINFSNKGVNSEEIMIEKISELSKKLNSDFKKIEKICIVRGPGRFTGIRISYSFARVYNAISRAQVYGVSVFELLTYNVLNKYQRDCEIRVVLNAFKDEYYLAGFKIRKGVIKSDLKPRWDSKEGILKKLKGFKGMVITDYEDNLYTYEFLNGFEKAPIEISKVIEENIIKAALYFKNKEIKPIYLKPAKFELL